MNLKTIPAEIAPRDVQAKMAAGLTQDQAVGILTAQHEHDLKHPNTALKRIADEKAKADADEADARKTEGEQSKADKEAAAKAKADADEETEANKKKAEEIKAANEKADAKKKSDLEAAADLKKSDKTGTETEDLSSLTVEQLRELAAKRNVDLSGLTLKADIIDAIEAAP